MMIHRGDYTLCFSGFSAVPHGSSQDPGVGIINAWHGFRVYNTATNGKFLKGNGNYYAEGAILAGDLPSHTHVESDVTNLVSDLAGKSNVGHTHPASDIVSGVLAMARLATGTPNGSKFVRDDGTLAVPPGIGTVTSVALTMPAQFSVSGSPITGAGTLAVTLANQVANIVFAGPSSGAAATPSFRALVSADLPSHTHANTDITGLGTASTHNVPASGNAASGEVVKGSDTRLTDARTPTSHTHAAADITSGVLLMARIASGTPDGTKFVRDDGTLAVPPNSGGTVTSVALSLPGIFSVSGSPITTSGTFACSLVTQIANKVFAGPTTGADAVPTFRVLVASDLPSHTHAQSDVTNLVSDLAGKAATSHTHAAADITSGVMAMARLATGTPDGTKFVRDDGTLAVPPSSSGTVTSVGLTMPSMFSVSGSPVTTSGTIACSLATQVANRIFAGPTTGSDAAPTFRAMVAGDLPSHTHAASDITSGTIATARLGSGTANATTFLRGDQTYAAPPTDSTATNDFVQTGSSDYTLTDSFSDVDFGDDLDINLPSSGDYLVTAILEIAGSPASMIIHARFAKDGVTVSGSERRVQRIMSDTNPQQLILQSKITASGAQTVTVQAKVSTAGYGHTIGYERSTLSYIKLAA